MIVNREAKFLTPLSGENYYTSHARLLLRYNMVILVKYCQN